MEPDKVLQKELQAWGAVKDLWDGGYYEGNPLDPMGASSYGLMGYMSVLHVIYLTCIKPYINEDSVVLEIGSGRGAWTKTFMDARQIWCLDAFSAEYNKFWGYIGNSSKVRYIQVKDFYCKDLPDGKFNYLFSFGALCHISFEGITEYMKNIYPKLIKGGQCFIMVADYEKYNKAVREANTLSAFRALDFMWSRKWYKKYFLSFFKSVLGKSCLERNIIKGLRYLDEPEDSIPSPGRWYNAGIKRTCDMLESLGYIVITPDMCVSNRDPIIHFCKPA